MKKFQIKIFQIKILILVLIKHLKFFQHQFITIIVMRVFLTLILIIIIHTEIKLINSIIYIRYLIIIINYLKKYHLITKII